MLEQLMKYKTWVIGILLIAGAVVYLSIYRNGLLSDALYWKNEAAKAKGLATLSETLYEQQIIETSKILIDNKELKDRLAETKSKAVYYEALSFKYQKALGEIQSKPADTVHIIDSTVYVPNTKDRQFAFADSELTLSGYFQPYSPYKLYVADLKLLFKLGIAISQDKQGTWFWDCNTSSKYLKPTQVSVHIQPRSAPWEYFVGGDIGFNRGLGGVDIRGGIKKGSWAVNAGVFLSPEGSLFGVGVIKFGEF